MPEGWCGAVQAHDISDAAFKLKGKENSEMDIGHQVNDKLGHMPLKKVTLEAKGDRIATTFKTIVEIKDAPHAGTEEISMSCPFVDLVPVVREDPWVHSVVGFGTWELNKKDSDTPILYEGWITEPSGKFKKGKDRQHAKEDLQTFNQQAQSDLNAVLSSIQVGSRSTGLLCWRTTCPRVDVRSSKHDKRLCAVFNLRVGVQHQQAQARAERGYGRKPLFKKHICQR